MERRPRQPVASGEQVEYVLTQKGLELKPAIIALAEWGDKWVRPGPVVFQHRSDGRPVQIQLRPVGRVGRADDNAKVAIADVVARPRSAVPPSVRAPSAVTRSVARSPLASAGSPSSLMPTATPSLSTPS
jgi:hypothetical protein